jgi:hypothetical protein
LGTTDVGVVVITGTAIAVVDGEFDVVTGAVVVGSDTTEWSRPAPKYIPRAARAPAATNPITAGSLVDHPAPVHLFSCM